MDDNNQEQETLISYNGVSISHDDITVIENVTFDVVPGDFIFLTGAVGSGKSSILRTIYGDTDISAGKADVLGYDMRSISRKQIPDLRRQLGIVFQDYKLLSNLTIAKNLAFVLKATGMKQKDEIEKNIASALKRVGLEGKENKFPSELSGGEQQRAAIARAIINNPKIILADEPTGNLDKNAAFNITQLLEQLSENGAAVIMSTHNLDLINKFTGKVFLCNHGMFSDVTNKYYYDEENSMPLESADKPSAPDSSTEESSSETSESEENNKENNENKE